MRILLLSFLSALLTGCAAMQAGKSAKSVIEAQHGGTATGAGATITAPNNAAAPSTQKAVRWTKYFPAPFASPLRPAPEPEMKISLTPEMASPVPAEAPPAPVYQPMPAETYDAVETRLGEHQSAGDLINAVAKLSGLWAPSRVWGCLFLIVGLGGALWSYKNEEGYMMVSLGTAAVSFALIMINGSGWWLLLLGFPWGFWAMQKIGFKIPGQ